MMAGGEGDHPVCTSAARKTGDTPPDTKPVMEVTGGSALEDKY